MRVHPAHFALAVTLLPLALRAQENLELGKMWTFENPPLAYLEDEYGFEPTEAWLDQLRLASLRFGGGCSASFVSPRGLIMTNHHCTRGQIAQVQGENDWLNEGFYAKALEDEVAVPGLSVRQLVSMQDVTELMNEGVEPSDDDDVIAKKRADNKAAILRNARGASPELEPEVVKLYQGAVFQLYSYKVWDDVRLVCSPHLQTAHFGGDPDNFTYPRYGIDFTFCRAYEDGEPADTSKHYFRWNSTGVLEGDLVFVTGNPGSTKRLLTYSQLEYHRDVWHPIVNELIDSRLAIRRELAAEKPALAKEMQAQMLSLENSQKALHGYHAGLLDRSLMNQKRAAEKAFRARVEADPALADRFGDVWDKITAVTARRARLEPKRRFQTTGGHPRILQAMRVLRGDRDTALEMAKEELTELQRADFVDHMQRAEEWLSEDELAWTDGKSAEALADWLEDSRLGDRDFVRGLLDGGDDAIQNSKDSALVVARALQPLIEANSAEHDELEAIEDAQGARIGQALHAAYGTSVSPDATGTPRFSDGVVAGYPCNGTLAPWRTTFYGLYARNVEFGNEYPFDLPQVWIDRKDRIDLTKSVDLVSTNDIIGGNSGSPLVDQNLQVVGLVFDGNIEMLPNRYLYRGDLPRSVSVHVDAITESLQKIYEADRILAELAGRGAAAPAPAEAR